MPQGKNQDVRVEQYIEPKLPKGGSSAPKMAFFTVELGKSGEAVRSGKLT